MGADIYDAHREHMIYTKEEYAMLRKGQDEDFSANEGRVSDD